MKESTFQNKVTKFLRDNNVYYVKVVSATKNGVPDLLICLNGAFVGVEIKNETGKESPLQKYNIDKIRESGGVAFILRPKYFEEFKKFILDKKRVAFSYNFE